MVALAAVVCLSACGGKPPDSGPFDGGRAQPVEAGTQAQEPAPIALSDFDRVVKLEVVFPDATQHALYRELPVATQQGKRIYAFELKPQRGMNPKRHFHIVSVAVGTATGSLDAGPSTLAGPNGAFNLYAMHTADGRFEISVSDGNLLPNSVDLPLFDLTRAASALADRYERLRDAP